MSDTPRVICFGSISDPNCWDIGGSKKLVFSSPSEAKRGEQLFTAMQRELAAREAELAEARDALQFVERWANYHGVKPTCTAKAALSAIQHYPPIREITESYKDGKIPETRNPWEELSAATDRAEKAEAERDKWREAVIDACVVRHIYTAEHDANPRKALNDCAAWDQMVALDPAVSSEAAELRDTYKAERDAAVKMLAEMVDAWDNGVEDDSMIASRRVTDAFSAGRSYLAAKGER